MVKKIINNNIDEIENANVAVVDFSAVWCGPCRMLAPVMEELSEEMKEEVIFMNADVDENQTLAEKFEISNIPALILFKNGKPVDMKVGFSPKEGIKNWIESKL